MSIPDRTTFPLETLTEHQREMFRQFITHRKKDQMNIREPIWFALLLAGKRPATEITIFGPPDDPDHPITPEEIAEAFDLNYQWWADTCLDVARSSWRLDLLPSQGEVSEAYHRRLGCFYGYSEEDVEHFLTGGEQRTLPADLVSNGVFSHDEVAYTTFVPQGHDDSIDGYNRAIEMGKTNRSTIEEYADNWGIPELAAYAAWIYHDARTDALIHS